MINLIDFMVSLVGKQVSFDAASEFNGECTQLVKKWAQLNGWSIPNGGSENAWGFRNYRNGYTFIRNSRYAVPSVGDIVVSSGGVGHVAIALPSDDSNLFCFGQNFTRSRKCSIEVHKAYSGVLS